MPVHGFRCDMAGTNACVVRSDLTLQPGYENSAWRTMVAIRVSPKSQLSSACALATSMTHIIRNSVLTQALFIVSGALTSRSKGTACDESLSHMPKPRG